MAAVGIDYSYAGQQLGGRKRLAYSDQRQTPGFRQALRELIKQSQERPTAVMCAEEDPYQCHRRFLISRSLMEDFAFLDIEHIRKDATLMVEAGFPESAVQLTLGI